ncbi:uncharacterized protein LOC143441435 isoform X2 [Arvicanthis niloticus]|uniref:uncharacterized protein LOC143441435 isoform X2 n=1 Tax=Arvicanthis niloticus TaxID=61156 RepID=UPI00403C303E
MHARSSTTWVRTQSLQLSRSSLRGSVLCAWRQWEVCNTVRRILRRETWAWLRLEEIEPRPFYMVNKCSTTELWSHSLIRLSLKTHRTVQDTQEHEVIVVYQGSVGSISGCLEKCRGW